MNTKALLLICITAAATIACKTTKPVATKTDMPADFAIKYEYSGGMVNHYRVIIIQADMSTDEEKNENGKFNYMWTTRREGLEELYGTLKANNSFTIEAEEKGKVYDRGGIKLTFTMNGQKTVVDNSNSSFVKESDIERFNQAVKLITDYANLHRTDK